MFSVEGCGCLDTLQKPGFVTIQRGGDLAVNASMVVSMASQPAPC